MPQYKSHSRAITLIAFFPNALSGCQIFSFFFLSRQFSIDAFTRLLKSVKEDSGLSSAEVIVQAIDFWQNNKAR